MRDPVEKMRKFIEEQKQRTRLTHARRVWAQRLPELLPSLEAVVETLRDGLAPHQRSRAGVALLVDPRCGSHPLGIAFDRRPYAADSIHRLQPEREHGEVGASAVFRVEADGQVHGYRYPFHSILSSPEPERFAELGDPASISPDELANAVVEFLQWASVGAGSGSRPVRFWAPAALVEPEAPVVKLAILAA